MKPTILLLALVLPCSGLPIRAAEGAPEPSAEARAALTSKLQAIADQLDLSDAQKAKISPILQQEATELRALQEDTDLRRRQKARRFREINQQASERIRAELTAEQQAKYDVLRAEAREEFKAKMKERRQAQGG